MSDEKHKCFVQYIKDFDIDGLKGLDDSQKNQIEGEKKVWGLCYVILFGKQTLLKELLKPSWDIDIYVRCPPCGFTFLHQIMNARLPMSNRIKAFGEMTEALLEREATLREKFPLRYQGEPLLKNIGDNEGNLPVDLINLRGTTDLGEEFEAVIAKVEKRHPGLTQTVLLDSQRTSNSTESIRRRLRRGGDEGEVPLLGSDKDTSTKSPRKPIKGELGFVQMAFSLVSRFLSGKSEDQGPKKGLRP